MADEFSVDPLKNLKKKKIQKVLYLVWRCNSKILI